MNKIHKPPHPGEVLLELKMKPLGISISDVAKNIGVNKKTIKEIISKHAAVTADIAIRLSKAFGTTAELWLEMQYSYDLWMAKTENRVDTSKIKNFAFL